MIIEYRIEYDGGVAFLYENGEVHVSRDNGSFQHLTSEEIDAVTELVNE